MSHDASNSQFQSNHLEKIYVSGDLYFNPTLTVINKHETASNWELWAQSIKTRKLNLLSPYRGLNKFAEKNTNYFFGRDQLILDLMKRLSQNIFTLLLGPSGSGKSSVVFAGLIPRLRANWDSSFIELAFHPDSDPFISLYSALTREYSQHQVGRVLREKDNKALVNAIKNLDAKEKNWIIYIDQLEELFTFTDKATCNQFIRNLVSLNQYLLNHKDHSVHVVMTMRSDFSGHLSHHPDLVRLIEKNTRIIPAMDRNELWMAIEEPAAHHGVVFEEGLTARIIKDVQGQAGYLPLLQYVLDLLWKQEQQKENFSQERTLHGETYSELGGVKGALEQRVTHIYEKFEEKEKLAVKRIFLKLVNITGDEKSDTDWKPLRRRVTITEFEDTLEKDLLQRLINQSLLVGSGLPKKQEATIEITHEILLDSWGQLKIWIQHYREAIALRSQLNNDVNQWKLKDSKDELWAGSKLQRVLELQRDSAFNQDLGGFTSNATQFISDSLKKREWQQRLKVIVAFSLTGLSLVALTTGGLAWLQSKRAEDTFRAFLLGIDPVKPDLFKELPKYLEMADQLIVSNTDDRSLNLSLAYYRRILSVCDELQIDVLRNRKDYLRFTHPEKTIAEIRGRANSSIIEIIINDRLPKLEEKLKTNQFGMRKTEAELVEDRKQENPNFDLDHDDPYDYLNLENNFTEGALRDTYRIIMGDLGIGADINENGMLDQKEAGKIPCSLLKEIEKLWRETTNNRCGWYGEDFGVASTCEELEGWTLTTSIFEPPYDIVLDRFNQCGIR